MLYFNKKLTRTSRLNYGDRIQINGYLCGAAGGKGRERTLLDLGACYMGKSFLWTFIKLLTVFPAFSGCSSGIWRFPGWGSNWSCSCRPTLQSQQLEIQAASAAYTTAHGSAGSPAHWARPGIKLHPHGCYSDSFPLLHNRNSCRFWCWPFWPV